MQGFYVCSGKGQFPCSSFCMSQDPTFEGLQDAMTNIIYSAWYNYVNFGSDIGGYRSGGPAPLGRTKELFTRWFEMGAFMPYVCSLLTVYRW
jgi:hypothetical protein